MTYTNGAVATPEPDDIRIMTYYDEHGRANNVEIVMNVQGVSADDINSIVANMRTLPANQEQRIRIPYTNTAMANPGASTIPHERPLIFDSNATPRTSSSNP